MSRHELVIVKRWGWPARLVAAGLAAGLLVDVWAALRPPTPRGRPRWNGRWWEWEPAPVREHGLDS